MKIGLYSILVDSHQVGDTWIQMKRHVVRAWKSVHGWREIWILCVPYDPKPAVMTNVLSDHPIELAEATCPRCLDLLKGAIETSRSAEIPMGNDTSVRFSLLELE